MMDMTSVESKAPTPFVTVLSVDGVSEHNLPRNFVTVLQVEPGGEVPTKQEMEDDDDIYDDEEEEEEEEEEVVIYRLPGERLGMGLKFEGGVQVSECISHLFIQSITDESPASRAKTKWGCLKDGDKILSIEGKDVSRMTRLDCVSALRDAPVALRLLIRRGTRPVSSSPATSKSPPPPVPARRTKGGIRLSPQIERAMKLRAAEEERSRTPTSPHPMPVEADLYINLIAEEDKLLHEYESDDTGSSVSTVIDRPPVAVYADVPSPPLRNSTTDKVTTFDLARALSPFEQLERELESEFQGLESNGSTIEPPEKFQDDIPQGKTGFVSGERRKFEVLLEKSPAPKKSAPPKRRKRPPPPPPPVPKISLDEAVKIEVITSPPPKEIKSILKKRNPPPVPPRRGKKELPAPPQGFTDNISNQDTIGCQDNVQSHVTCPENRGQSEASDSKWRRQAVESWLEASVLMASAPKKESCSVAEEKLWPLDLHHRLASQPPDLEPVKNGTEEKTEISEDIKDSGTEKTIVEEQQIKESGEAEEGSLPAAGSSVTAYVSITAPTEPSRVDGSSVAAANVHEQDGWTAAALSRSGVAEMAENECAEEVLVQLPSELSRLPPDGHEFPPNFQDPIMSEIPCNALLVDLSEDANNNNNQNSEYIQPPSGFEDPSYSSCLASFPKMNSSLLDNCTASDQIITAEPLTNGAYDSGTEDSYLLSPVPLETNHSSLPSPNESLTELMDLGSSDIDFSSRSESMHSPPSVSPAPPLLPNSASPNSPHRTKNGTAYGVSSPLSDETDSIDTLDSAVDCELPEPETNGPYVVRTPSQNCNQELRPLANAQPDNKNECSQDKKNDMKMEKPVLDRVMMRNIDEKNIMSLKEKIAMFSQMEDTEPISPTKKTQKIRDSIKDNIVNGNSEHINNHRNIERKMSVPENKSEFTNRDHKMGLKNGIYCSLGNITNLNENEKNNDESLSKTSGLSQSSEELLSSEVIQEPNIKLRCKSLSDVKVQRRPFSSSTSEYFEKSDMTKLNPKRYSIGSYTLNRADSDWNITNRNNSSSTSLYSMLESRRQKASKLRGLIIPEKPENNISVSKNVPLPTIVSADSVFASKPAKVVSCERPNSTKIDTSKFPKEDTVDSKIAPSTVLSTPPWKGNTTDLPKYSPAFKRKALSILQNSLPANRSPSNANRPTSLTSPLQTFSAFTYYNGNQSSKSETSSPTKSPDWSPTHEKSSVDFKDASVIAIRQMHPTSKSAIKPITSKQAVSNFSPPPNSEDTIDSEDRDSVISSAGSYLSHSLSPPMSPRERDNSKSPVSVFSSNKFNGCLSEDEVVEEYIVVRIEDNMSDEVDHKKPGSNAKPKLVRVDSVEAINRRNILEQAKHSNGGFLNGLLNGVELFSPDVQDETDQPKVDTRPTIKDVIPSKNLAEISAKPNEKILKNDGNTRKNYSVAIPEAIKPVVQTEEKRSDKAISAERWSELEKKYGSSRKMEDDVENRISSFRTRHSRSESLDNLDKQDVPLDPDLRPRKLSQQKTVLTGGNQGAESAKTFKALAEKWEQRSFDTSPVSPTPAWNLPTTQTSPAHKHDSVSSPVELKPISTPPNKATTTNTKENGISAVPVRKYSAPAKVTEAVAVKMREHRPPVLTRPVSMIETNRELKPLQTSLLSGGSYLQKNASSELKPLHKRSSSKDLLDLINGSKPTSNSSSVSDIRRAFEIPDGPRIPVVNGKPLEERSYRRELRNSSSSSMLSNHNRMSSCDSTASESDASIPAHYGSVNSLTSNARDHYGSITSLASSTSLISPQELQQLIEEANQSLEESGTPSHEILVVVFHKEIPGSSIGITLAGGADYEAKEITVHKVINGSLADRDGRIQKGDRVLSINGKNLKGITHREALNILKTPRPECVLVISRSQERSEDGSTPVKISPRISGLSSLKQEPTSPLTNSDIKISPSVPRGNIITLQIVKDAAGLGFSLDGGKDSPLGDRPISIKKIFQGGAAEKNGILKIGDEIISVNGISVTNMARIEAWNFMKKQPDGIMTFVIRQV